MKTIQVIDENGKVVADIKNCKTIKGAKGQIKKSSIAMHAGWKIRIEETI